ncbi:MobQ family relaxase [Chthonobacter rhizosphaerae]|uniref:MobQ family relaxase n=1 Tax=Chthonobacter rhizosphaerae TaxID=2735553 RepID=UPI0015EE699F|nr:MobQ family relaxase [Chthonobacter rhizosphaerae]
MAQYRFSASIIGRKSGKSATAAAAYRSAEKIHDHRTGETHDYTAKRGVVHTEIMAPESTPEWMRDRHALWNAVEAAERRKDSQLAREITLSLPHELNDRQRIDLVRGYVREQFVERGLIVDFAIHQPEKQTDRRNHHAHLMITMRELTSDGFGKKIRLSEPARISGIEREREEWANHQNRLFERLNLPTRVDHRSYEARGIDRIPTKHLGPTAAAMEKEGKRSRLGDENREIIAENARIAENYRLQAEAENTRKLVQPLPPEHKRRDLSRVYNYRVRKAPDVLTRREEAWAQRDHERKVKIERREMYALIELGRKHDLQRVRLEADQKARNDTFKRTVVEEMNAIDRRMQAKGVTRFLRDLTGKSRSDQEARALHEKTLRGVIERELEELKSLENTQALEVRHLTDKYQRAKASLEKEIATRQDRLQQALERAMDDERDRDKKNFERRPPPLPKPEHSYKPAPPKGAGPPRMPGDQESYDRKVQDWARSEEGRKALARDPNPNQHRLDFEKAKQPARGLTPEKEPTSGPPARGLSPPEPNKNEPARNLAPPEKEATQDRPRNLSPEPTRDFDKATGRDRYTGRTRGRD